MGDSPSRAALDGDDVDERLVILLRLIADRDPVRIWRNAVIVIAVIGEACVDDGRRAAGCGYDRDAVELQDAVVHFKTENPRR